MRRGHRWAVTALSVVGAFCGGLLSARLGRAGGERDSPYAPLSQLGRVLVLVENQFVDPVDRQRLLDGVIRGMVAELDPHSAYMTPSEFALFNEDTEGSFGGIGVEVDFKDDRVLVLTPIEGSPAARAGVRAGDQIVAVDGKLLRGMPIDKIVRLMRGPPDTKVRVTIKRTGKAELLHLELVRQIVRVRSVEGKRLAGALGYLRLKQFQQGTHEELLAVLGDLRRASDEPLAGVLLDLRNNPGGLVDEAEAVADEILSTGTIYTTRHRGRIIDDARAHLGGALSGLPVVILVNEYTASSAELLAGALKDNDRARLVGGRTFGKGSVQTIFELPGGAGLRLTTMRYYTPDGRAIQAAGIEPDVRIEYREDAEQPELVLHERDLEGHLQAEAPVGAAPEAGKVVVADKRVEPATIAEVPAEPKMDGDVALAVAYRELVAAARER